MEGMTFTNRNHFPQLAPYNGNVEFEVISYSDRKKHDGKNQALHFFLDDYRFRDAIWCMCGYNVIPTASWGNADSFKYCYEGLPENSIIAVGGMGHHHCRAAESLWHFISKRLRNGK